MRGTSGSGAWSRAARIAGLIAGTLVLAGCVADYAYVQPGVAGGGAYYTSEGPYSSQSDYGYYGAGSYGYYDGYGGYGYWPGSGFDLSSGWDFPGYWGYSTVVPVWGCRDGCRRGWRHHDHHGHHGGHDPVATSPPHPWLHPDHPRVPPGSRGAEPSAGMRARPVEWSAGRRVLPSARFAPHDFVRAPDSLAAERFDIPARPVSMSRVPAGPDFANRRMPIASVSGSPVSVQSGFADRRRAMMPTGQAFRAQAPVARSAPATVAPVRAAPPPPTAAHRVRIP